MPVPKVLLPIPHQPQQSDGDCLAACATTGELPYWTYGTDHALLVVGCDEDQMYVNDPACSEFPITVPWGDFELAWLARDYYYALITL